MALERDVIMCLNCGKLLHGESKGNINGLGSLNLWLLFYVDELSYQIIFLNVNSDVGMIKCFRIRFSGLE